MSRDTYNRFKDEFIILDNLCRDIYTDTPSGELGVTQYIKDMKCNKLKGEQLVPGWCEDYEQLLHLRSKRNADGHEIGVDRDNLFSEEDVLWIMSFHRRIINGNDPLSKLFEVQKKGIQQQKQFPKNVIVENQGKENREKKSDGIFNFFMGIGIVSFITIIICLLIIFNK